ncbi:MAG: polymer-forming cytoskeletal protein [Deltaproteobacteria bacterium]
MRFTAKNGNGKSQSFYTIIGPEVFFEGTLTSQGAVRIDGRFKGRIESEGAMLIGKTGKVEGDVVAQSVLVAGELIGNATAKKHLEIRENGKLYGDISTEQLVMEPGVVFEGKCHMNSHNSAPAFSETDSPSGTESENPTTPTDLHCGKSFQRPLQSSEKSACP